MIESVESTCEAPPEGLVPSALATVDDRSLPDLPEPPVRNGVTLGGRRFGRFRTLEKLGEGGMGVVLAAHDEQLDRRVALKFLTRAGADNKARERLFREARSLARLSHPNIVAVYDVGEIDALPYLAMELVEGCTLRAWIEGDAERPSPGRLEVLRMFLEIGHGLAAAHELGVVHRDFKPDNVLVGADGRPRVVDFGLASIGKAAGVGRPAIDDDANPSLTATGAMMGTPAYMAPEQWHGQAADARSDQFSFCVALFAALYGRAPFEGATMAALMAAVLEEDPAAIPAAERVPDPLHRAILRGLARDPEQRWPSLSTLLERIEAALAEVQPGLFTGVPTPIVGFAIPLVILLPLIWLALELFGVVEYAASSWAWLSAIQVTLMGCGALAVRRRLVEFVGDRRMLAGPAFMIVPVIGHRLIVAATGSSI
jgi:eukaryotic-like serine/threonine-protein kinase